MPTVLITGGTSGIGLELAKLFLKDNYHVVIAARSRALPASLENKGITYIRIDLSKPGSAQKLSSKLRSKNITVHSLVNNAGLGDYSPFADSNLQTQQDMIQLNITTVTELTHLLLPELTKNKGKILFLGSTAAFIPGPNMSVYFATKHYVFAFAEALQVELRGKVGVTALCPGPTKSKFQETAHVKSGTYFRGKLPSAEEVARYGYVALNQGKVVAVHGLVNKLLTQIVRFLPRSVVRRQAYKQGKLS